MSAFNMTLKSSVLMALFVARSLAMDEESVRVYPYMFTESTGVNQHTLVGMKVRPILRFSPDSSPEAVRALRSLKSHVLYENSDGNKIYLRGRYNENDSSFVLKSWFIISPFYSRVLVSEEDFPHEARLEIRKSLAASDFSSDVGDPSKFVIEMPDPK